jgi:multiple sugar transport system permease protein
MTTAVPVELSVDARTRTAVRTGRFRITSPRKTMSSIAVYVVLALVGLFFIAPLLWIVLSSLEPGAAIGTNAPLVLTLNNFGNVLNWSTFFQPLINSLIISGSTAALTVACSLFAAYPLSRYQLRFRKTFLYTIIFTTGLPITAIMVPVYELFARLSLVDNYFALILFLTATALPFGIWLMKGFMDGVPVDLEQAAWVDGASWVASLRTIVAPLMMPGIAVITIFTFAGVWGNFFVPFILLTTQTKFPMAVSIGTFFGQYGSVEYGELAAFSILYTLPALGLYVAAARFLRGKFTFAGATKG